MDENSIKEDDVYMVIHPVAFRIAMIAIFISGLGFGAFLFYFYLASQDLLK